jgi:DNA-binding HxlR family transcriptional regulator
MRDHPVRLSELKRTIPAASKKALVANLRILETERLVLRRDLSSAVLHVEYRLASGLRDPLVAVLECLFEWSRLHFSLLEDADAADNKDFKPR